jgi:hypothetical protein
MIYKLFTGKQKNFLQTKERLKTLSLEKEARELDLRRAKNKHEDRQVLLEEAEVDVEKVRSALQEATRYVENWTTFHDGPCSSDVSEIIGHVNVSDKELHTSVSELQEQLCCKERNMKQSQTKVLATKLEWQRCIEALASLQDAYNEVMVNQVTSERYLIAVAECLVRLRAGNIDSPHPMPIERPVHFIRTNVIHVKDCPVCGEHFYCNDMCITPCEHYYHPWCLKIYFSRFSKCKFEGYGIPCDSLWRLSFGLFESADRERSIEDSTTCLHSLGISGTFH